MRSTISRLLAWAYNPERKIERADRLLLTAKSLVATQWWELAIAVLNKVVKMNPKCAAALILRAGVYLQCCEMSLALEDATNALTLDSTCIEACHIRGTVFALAQNRMQAIHAYEATARLQPSAALTKELKSTIDEAFAATGQMKASGTLMKKDGKYVAGLYRMPSGTVKALVTSRSDEALPVPLEMQVRLYATGSPEFTG